MCLVIPIGACNPLAMVKTLNNQVFHDCKDEFFIVYIDDILFFRKEKETYYRHLQTVISRKQENELYTSLEKREFLKHAIDYGTVISENGRIMNPNKSNIIIS